MIKGFHELEPEDTTSLWRHLLRQASNPEWVKAINSCTLEGFDELVGGELPPTPSQLISLAYNETNRPGVHLAVIYCEDTTGHRYVYIGSASSPYGGLKYRVSQHKSATYSSKAA